MSCSKLRYSTQWIALRANACAIAGDCQRRNRKFPTGTYLCGECRSWHLTSKSGNQIPPWERKRARRRGDRTRLPKGGGIDASRAGACRRERRRRRPRAVGRFGVPLSVACSNFQITTWELGGAHGQRGPRVQDPGQPDLFSSSAEPRLGLRLGQMQWPDPGLLPVNHANGSVRDQVWQDLVSSRAPLVLAGFASITKIVELVAAASRKSNSGSVRVLLGTEPFTTERVAFGSHRRPSRMRCASSGSAARGLAAACPRRWCRRSRHSRKEVRGALRPRAVAAAREDLRRGPGGDDRVEQFHRRRAWPSVGGERPVRAGRRTGAIQRRRPKVAQNYW